MTPPLEKLVLRPRKEGLSAQYRGQGCDGKGWTSSAGLGESAVGWVYGVQARGVETTGGP